MTYFLAMERSDGSMDEPFIKYTNKTTALRVAKIISKSASFDCTKLWIEDFERNGIMKFNLPLWKS